MSLVQHHHRFEKGQATVEYAILIAMVSIVVTLGLVALSRGLNNSYQEINDALTSDALPGIPAETTESPEATAEVTEDVPGDESITTPEPEPVDSGDTVEPDITDELTNLNSYYDAFNGSGNITWRNIQGTWTTSSQKFNSNGNNATVISSNIGLSNYEFTSNVQTTASQGTESRDVTMVLFRVANANTYYAVMLKKDGMVELAKSTNGVWQGWLSITATSLSPFDNHTFRIKAQREHIQVFIDNRKYVDFRDANPIDSGGVGFSVNNAAATVDNVEVDRRGQS